MCRLLDLYILSYTPSTKCRNDFRLNRGTEVTNICILSAYHRNIFVTHSKFNQRLITKSESYVTFLGGKIKTRQAGSKTRFLGFKNSLTYAFVQVIVTKNTNSDALFLAHVVFSPLFSEKRYPH